MARKSKRDDLAPSSAPEPATHLVDPGRQPRFVGWLVLIVGGFSSWYWYKPLPDSVNQAAHATGSSSWASAKSGPHSLWTDETLLIPSTDLALEKNYEFKSDSSIPQSENANLVGKPNVTLVPWNEPQRDIRDVLKTERVPMVPVTPNFNETAKAPAPQVWTPEQQHSSRIGEPSNTSSKWPDVGYVPPQKAQKEQQRAAAKITTQIPKLLETGMKSIQPQDLDEPVGQSNPANLPSQPAPLVQPAPLDGSPRTIPSPTAPPAKQPQFIRQPSSKPFGKSTSGQ